MQNGAILPMQFDLDKLEKDSLEWKRAMIKMLLQLKKDGHKIKEIVNGSGNKVSGIGKRVMAGNLVHLSLRLPS